MNRAVNRGILAGFSQGLLTSTAILTNAPAFADAVRGWIEIASPGRRGALPSADARCRLGEPAQPFDLGVHLNLTQGRPLTGPGFPRQLVDADGRFLGVFQLLPRLFAIGARHRKALRDELSAQIERLLDAGLAPTHLNGHQYVEMLPVVADIIPELLDRYAVPSVRVARERSLTRIMLRGRLRPAEWGLAQVKHLFALHFARRMRGYGVSFPDAYFGTAHAGRIDIALVDCFLSASPVGLTEIGVHPGDSPASGDDESCADGWHDPLAALRPGELEWLTSRTLPECLARHGVLLGRIAPVRSGQGQLGEIEAA